MRIARALPAAGLFVGLLVAPAWAAPGAVTVGDNFFKPTSVQVGVGESVKWTWNGTATHNVSSSPRQVDRFKSPSQAGTGKTYTRTFKRPGRFSYLCTFHPSEMRATVQVGTPETDKPDLTRVRARGSGRTGKVRLKLSERSVVTVKVRGPKRKTVRKTYGPGRHTVRVRRLKAGRYKASVQAKDGWGNKSRTARKRFRIRG